MVGQRVQADRPARAADLAQPRLSLNRRHHGRETFLKPLLEKTYGKMLLIILEGDGKQDASAMKV